MRIAFLVEDLSGKSGWSRYALDLGNALMKRKHEVHTLVHRGTPGIPWATQHPILPETLRAMHPLLCMFHSACLRRCLQNIQPSIVHSIAEPYGLLLGLTPKEHWKTFLTLHGSYAVTPLRIGPCTRFLARRALARADRIITVSNFTRNFLRHEEPLLWKQLHLEEKTFVLHNAVDCDAFHMHVSPPASQEHHVLSVGAVKERKGYREMILACAAFRKENPEVRLRYTIIGSLTQDPRYVASIRSLIAQHGLADIVTLRGNVDDAELYRAYTQSSLFMLLSQKRGTDFEGFGLVFLEAAAMGIPVIGPNTGGCPEAIAEGRSGFVVDPSDSRAVANRMQDILVKRAINRKECRQWAEQHTATRTAGELEEHYKNVLKEPT